MDISAQHGSRLERLWGASHFLWIERGEHAASRKRIAAPLASRCCLAILHWLPQLEGCSRRSRLTKSNGMHPRLWHRLRLRKRWKAEGLCRGCGGLIEARALQGTLTNSANHFRRNRHSSTRPSPEFYPQSCRSLSCRSARHGIETGTNPAERGMVRHRFPKCTCTSRFRRVHAKFDFRGFAWQSRRQSVAPAASSKTTMSAWPAQAAKYKGVSPSFASAFTSAPASSSTRAMSAWPCLAAR